MVNDFDVIVVGGGTSGVSAAIASARTGAKTLVIERLGALGGQMNVSGPPGFAYAYFFNGLGEQVVGGIMAETHKRLLDAGHALPHSKPDYRAKGSGYTFSYVDPDWWGLMIFEMMTENGVTLLLHSLAVDVVKEGNTVKGVVVENASGRQEIRGKIIIDCTGEGDIAVKAGAPYEMVSRDEIQPHTLSFTADGINWDEFLQYMKANIHEFDLVHLIHPDLKWTPEQIAEGLKNVKDITEVSEIMGFFSLRDAALAKGEWHPYSGVGFFLIPREGGVVQAHFQHSSQVVADPTDAWDLTRAEIECRRQITIAFKFFRKYVPGFENAYITRVCPELRIREGRRIMGDYVLTTGDVGACRKFDDVIGKSSFKAGGHHAATLTTLKFGAQRVWPKDGGSYDIPYRCLVPRNVENLLVGGKMVSTDRDAYLRYLQQTMVTGQAAGAAAGICATTNITPRQLEKSVPDLQKVLLEQGAILYNTH